MKQGASQSFRGTVRVRKPQGGASLGTEVALRPLGQVILPFSLYLESLTPCLSLPLRETGCRPFPPPPEGTVCCWLEVVASALPVPPPPFLWILLRNPTNPRHP